MLKAQVILYRCWRETMLKVHVTTSVLARNDVESAGYYIGAGIGTDAEMNVILQQSILDCCWKFVVSTSLHTTMVNHRCWIPFLTDVENPVSSSAICPLVWYTIDTSFRTFALRLTWWEEIRLASYNLSIYISMFMLVCVPLLQYLVLLLVKIELIIACWYCTHAFDKHESRLNYSMVFLREMSTMNPIIGKERWFISQMAWGFMRVVLSLKILRRIHSCAWWLKCKKCNGFLMKKINDIQGSCLVSSLSFLFFFF